MSQSEILLPKMGESVAEATIIKWLKNEGEFVKADEPIVEIATDKVDSEVPSTAEGILLKRLCNEGDVIQVGKAIALIGAEGSKPATPSQPASKIQTEKPTEAIAIKTVPTNGSPKISNSNKFYSPLVKNIAKTEGLTEVELETIEGTGLQGRITKKDILGYLPNRNKTSVQEIKTETIAPVKEIKVSEPSAPIVNAGPNDEIIEMDRMRKLIAEHMVMSKRTSPHVTSFVEADVTNIAL